MARWWRKARQWICSSARSPTTPAPCLPLPSGWKPPATAWSANSGLLCDKTSPVNLGATLLALGMSLQRKVPDIVCICGDGAVGREPGHPRDVEDRRPRPCRLRLPTGVDAALRCVIGIEVRAHHVMIEVAQRMRD